MRAIELQYSSPDVTDRFPRLLASIALVTGCGVSLFYYQQGLTLSHYDAKAHLVVARRVLDSLTPEYSQIGAVWLPLPHLLNLLPVQIDAFYRTGASAVAISIVSFAVVCYAAAYLVQQITGSKAAAAVAVFAIGTDPNVLYLQSTPMTELLLFALVLMAIAAAYDWVDLERREPLARRDVDRARARTAWLLVAACLTRYEAWPVTWALLALALVALVRAGRPVSSALSSTVQAATYPALAILAFFFHSWFTTGEWFVTGGFFVPDNVAYERPLAALGAVMYGVRILAGRPFVVIAIAGALLLAWHGLRTRERAPALVALALVALLVLPAYAFYRGHPFRMRYMVAPTVGAWIMVGIAIGMIGAWPRRVAALVVAIWLGATLHPLDAHAPMVQEAQWDVPFSRGRRHVTECLTRDYHGEPILASMGSLAHYMQELSHEGLDIRNFVHEGNLPYWQLALAHPQGQVGWILAEERAEGGDVVAARTRESSDFLTGFRRVCADGGVALYRADDNRR
jgi:hypothetical protein